MRALFCDSNETLDSHYIVLIFVVAPQTEVTSITSSQFVLACTTFGSPAIIDWSLSNQLKNDSNHQIVQTLLNGTASSFVSTHTFTQHPYPEVTGEGVCRSTTYYVSANSSVTTLSTARGLCDIHVQCLLTALLLSV